MSLYKIPVVVFLTRNFVSIFSPPQPAAAKQETAETIAIDIPWVRRWRLAFVKIGQILLGLFEITTIVYQHLYPQTQKMTQHRTTTFQSINLLPPLYATPISIIGAILWILGAQLRLSAFASLGRYFRFDISIQDGHRLITVGPYAYFRHPSYTGAILANMGWICYHFSAGSWLRESALMNAVPGKLLVGAYMGIGLLPTLFVTLGRMEKEEAMLKRQFGKEWEAWASRVSYKICPGIY